MNSNSGTTAYFTSESDAQRAAEDLRAQGYDVDVRSEGSHGQGFWESIKSVFGGETTHDQYASGAILTVEGGDPITVRTVVSQYNGRLNDTTQTITGSTSGSTGTFTDEYTGTPTTGRGVGGTTTSGNPNLD